MESLQVQDLAFWDRLSPEERERVERSAHSVRYGAGQMIWSGELDCLGILMVRSGVVRLFLSSQDGREATIARMADEGKVRWEDYPAFKWCRDLGEGWYLPAINEVLRIGHLYNNGRIKFDRKAREQFNNRLKEHGGVKMDRLMYYFSSTEGDDAWTAMTTHMGIEPPFVEQTSKNISFLVRAMHKF